MNYKMIANLIGKILCVEAVFLIPAAAVSFYFGEPDAMYAIILSCVITAVVGLLLLIPKPSQKNYYAREGFVCVAIAWIALSLFGALPFYLSKEIPSFLDCLFETISGFTTTGASILPNVELLSKGLIYWRSFTHWLGGMGVLVFVLALQPVSRTSAGSGQSLHLLRAESPGPEVEKLVPKMHQSAKILYGIYIGMTALQMILMRAGGMPLFDTVTVAFGTAGTGGFAIRVDSIAGYSHYLQTIITIFMALFGVNFSVYYLLLIGKFSQAMRNSELRLYIGIMVSSILLITVDTVPFYHSVYEAFHHSAFQVSSIMTTTGFSTVDFNLWPEFSKTILLLLMIIGASAGSTGGGIKVSRLLLMFKSMRCAIKRILFPRSVSVVRMDGKMIEDNTMRGVNLYLTAYSFITAVSILIVSLNNFGIETSVSAVLACLNNIGPGLGIAGPMSSYASFDALSKVVLSLDMLIGRLEIFPILMILLPSTWRKGQ